MMQKLLKLQYPNGYMGQNPPFSYRTADQFLTELTGADKTAAREASQDDRPYIADLFREKGFTPESVDELLGTLRRSRSPSNLNGPDSPYQGSQYILPKWSSNPNRAANVKAGYQKETIRTAESGMTPSEVEAYREAKYGGPNPRPIYMKADDEMFGDQPLGRDRYADAGGSNLAEWYKNK